MNFLKKISPEYILRVSLGAMYLYSGFDLVMNPTGWYWALRPLPDFILNLIELVGKDNFLIIQGGVEILFAIVFLCWFVPKIFVKLASSLSSVQMILILTMVGVTGDTFRDIGILGASLALFFMLIKQEQNNY